MLKLDWLISVVIKCLALARWAGLTGRWAGLTRSVYIYYMDKHCTHVLVNVHVHVYIESTKIVTQNINAQTCPVHSMHGNMYR